MQPRQGPPPNQPNRAPYKAPSQPTQANYGINENAQTRRRPPIQTGGAVRGLTNPVLNTLPTASGAGYPGQRHQGPAQGHILPPTTQPQGPQTGYFPVFPGQAPVNQQQQAYFGVYNQPVPPQAQGAINPARQPIISQPAPGRKPPVPHSNLPLTSQFGSDSAVDNKQTLQMPLGLQNVPGRHPIPSGHFVPSQGRQPPVTTTLPTQITTQAAQPPVVPINASFGINVQQRQPIVGGPQQSAPEIKKQPAPQTAVKAAPTTSAAIAASTAPASKAAPTTVSQVISDAAKTSASQEQTSGPKKTAAAPNKPWIQFTGPGKKEPIFATWATVRQVNSGHSFRLAVISSKQSGSTKLIDFTLEGIRTPAVARSEKNTDAPFAYEAREFVRNLVSSGVPLLCCAWSVTKDKVQRFFGDIYVPTAGKNANDPKGNKESLTFLVVSKGYADLTPKEKTQLSPTEYEKLSKALEKAKKSGLGKFVDGGVSTEDEKKKPTDNKKKGGKQQPHVRKLVFAREPEERSEILRKYQNKEISAIVDHVRSGSSLRLELVADEKSNTHELVVVNLAGCAAPRTSQPSNEEENQNPQRGNRKIERYSNEAKEFTEQRLLSQRVTVKIVASDQNANLYAIVSHPKGQIAVSLLRNGFAEYVSWTAQLLSKEDQTAMKDALKEAQEKRLHIWQYKNAEELPHDYVPVTVTQVISGDSFIAKFEDGHEERFTLSSIHQPRFKEDSKKSKKTDGAKKEARVQSPYVEHPWARPAKEFLREKLIGKKVLLLNEYKKSWKTQSDDQNESKTQKNESKKKNGSRTQKYAAVMVDKENVAVALVAAGLAEVVTFGQEKSVAYLELQKAQEKAKKSKKGIYSNTTPKEIFDYSQGFDNFPQNAVISLQNYLLNQKRKAVVEYVISGHRMKVFIPDQNCFISLMLAHVQCDPIFRKQGGKGQRSENSTATAALTHVNQRIWQRNVEVEVVGGKDKKDYSGSWKAKVWVNGKDLGLELLEKGLARVVYQTQQPWNARGKRPNPTSDVPSTYLETEAAAREKKVGRWEEIVARRQEMEEKRKQNDMTGKEATVVISQIDNGAFFFVNKSESNELEKLEEAMSRLRSQRPSGLRVGKLVGALFDGLYCRAKIIRQDTRNERSWIVLFIDYGNKAVVAEKDMTNLSGDVTPNKFRPLAQSCQLAALRPPRRGNEFYNPAGEYFAKLVMPSNADNKSLKELKVKVLFDDNRKWQVVLYDQNVNINEQMLKEGYVRFDSKGKSTPPELIASKDEFTQEYLKTAKKLNDEALEERRGLWKFGDSNSDEEELF